MGELKWINEAWLDGLKRTLACTAKTIEVRERDFSVADDSAEDSRRVVGEEPNPAYERLQRQIEAAEYHLATKERVIEKARAAGFRPNSYPGKCVATGNQVQPGAGFVRKEDGQWRTYSRDAVIELLGIQINGLPEIEE